MKVNLRCFADLSKVHECDYDAATQMELTEGSTVEAVIQQSGIPRENVKIVFVNGRISSADQSLQDGDRVALVPATGGM